MQTLIFFCQVVSNVESKEMVAVKIKLHFLCFLAIDTFQELLNASRDVIPNGCIEELISINIRDHSHTGFFAFHSNSVPTWL